MMSTLTASGNVRWLTNQRRG